MLSSAGKLSQVLASAHKCSQVLTSADKKKRSNTRTLGAKNEVHEVAQSIFQVLATDRFTELNRIYKDMTK